LNRKRRIRVLIEIKPIFLIHCFAWILLRN
jgi:hypothetical protein